MLFFSSSSIFLLEPLPISLILRKHITLVVTVTIYKFILKNSSSENTEFKQLVLVVVVNAAIRTDLRF